MSPKLKSFLQRWLVNTLGVLVAANVVNGIRYDTVLGLVMASLLLGILNAFVRPIMIVLALPLLLFTLGLFILVINALLLYFVGGLLRSFHVDSFTAAFLGALLISLVSLVCNAFLGTGGARVQVTTGRQSRRRVGPPGPPTDGPGPVIDV
jgi:putative membrane protein